MTTSAMRRLMAAHDMDQRELNRLSIRLGHSGLEHCERFIRIML